MDMTTKGQKLLIGLGLFTAAGFAIYAVMAVVTI